ncbi:MAG TPA: hypothetical protein VFR82_08680, partial [Nitrospira sp.]|nr:hypothetical protein [Nitrospira sp.]
MKPSYRLRFLVLALAISPVACAAARQGATVPEPSGSPMQRVTVLSYNTLHGLEPSGLTVKPSESNEARQARLHLQFEQLAVARPELILLQEVNPLPEMAETYVAAMKRVGVEYSQVHQVDACGVRLAPGLAVVPYLNNGLVVLAKAPLKLRKVAGLKLSGGLGRCDDYMGLQTGELRYALVAEVENP